MLYKYYKIRNHLEISYKSVEIKFFILKIFATIWMFYLNNLFCIYSRNSIEMKFVLWKGADGPSFDTEVTGLTNVYQDVYEYEQATLA